MKFMGLFSGSECSKKEEVVELDIQAYQQEQNHMYPLSCVSCIWLYIEKVGSQQKQDWRLQQTSEFAE